MINSADIDSLIRAMTLEEKTGQLTMIEAGGATPEVTSAALREGRAGSILNLSGRARLNELQQAALESRLRIPALFTLDVLHGYETMFPIPLGEAAAFDPALWEATARAAAVEAAADGIHLTFAPMLDISRDPRWGRIAESPGEDPWLGSRFAEAKVRGFQGAGISNADAIAATAKHFAAYGAVTAGREYAPVDISERTLHEVYLPPFAAAVRAGTAAIMPAFTDLAGVPMTAHEALLNGLVRVRWLFDGVYVSDYTAIPELMNHGVAADAAEAAALALNAGIDIDMVGTTYRDGLPVALERGLVTLEQIDAAVRRVLTLKARLGLFDAPFARGTGGVTPAQRAAHRELARDAARRSMVLLRNSSGLLPLTAPSGHLAILGPLANSRKDMPGPWQAACRMEEVVTIAEGVRAALPGWRISEPPPGSGVAVAGDIAAQADVVLLCLGEREEMCGEGGSRANPVLPWDERLLVGTVMKLGKPVIVALLSGRPLADPWLFLKADTIIAAWFPGSQAGTALGDVLTGKWNPSGRLPVTWPQAAGQIPVFYAQRPTGRPADPNVRTTSKYLDMPNEPRFPFGHGLSYTRFAYSNPRVTPGAARAGERLRVEVDIANEGEREGEATALLFIRAPVSRIARPLLELRGMGKLTLAPHSSGTLVFDLSTDDLRYLDGNLQPALEAGELEILVGPSADRASLLKTVLRILPRG